MIGKSNPAMKSADPFPPGGFPKPVAQPFIGRHISLQPLHVTPDTPALYAASHEPDSRDAIWRYMTVGPFADATSMSLWLHGRSRLPDMIPFTVRNQASGAIIGSISLMTIRPEHGAAELGFIWYIAAAQRTKANTEAAYLLLHYCFHTLRYRRIEWKCDAENARSRAAASRLGFTFEGIFRQHMIVKGRNRDTAWFAMCDHEWPRIGAEVRRWLYDDDSHPLSVAGRA